MNDPKTIGELLALASKSMVASHKKVVADLPEADARNEGFGMGVAYAADKFKEINDYSIVGPGSVVSLKGLEAGAKVLCQDRALEDGVEFDDEWGDGDNAYVDNFRAALKEAGVVVVDRVGHISKEGSIACCDAEGKHDVLPFLKGDNLYIERANTSAPADEDRGVVTCCDKGE